MKSAGNSTSIMLISMYLSEHEAFHEAKDESIRKVAALRMRELESSMTCDALRDTLEFLHPTEALE